MSSKHLDADERFADWLDGRMAPRDRERFEAELRVNPTLRARAEQYRRTVETVQQALRAPLPKIDVADAVLARIQKGETAAPAGLSTQPWRTASRRALWYSSGVAAAVFALLALLIEWQPPPESTDSARAPAGTAAPGERSEVAELGRDDDAKDEKGAADGAILLVQPQAPAPAADPSVVAELERRFADARKAEVRQPSGEVPLETASTMLPHVLLQQQATYREADRQKREVRDDIAKADEFFLGYDTSARDLRQVLPAGTLQIQQLRAAPPPTRTATWVGQNDREAWLVEGTGPEVYSYLARLSEVGRSCGFDVANGEVATADVQALLLDPASAPSGQTSSYGATVDQLAGRTGGREQTKDTAGGETQLKPAGERPVPDAEADAVEQANPVAAAPKPAGGVGNPRSSSSRLEGAPADRAQEESVDKSTGSTKRRGAPAAPGAAAAAQAENVERKLGAAERSWREPADAPGAPPPPPPETPAPRVRVVIVIERAARAPTNR